MTFDTWAFEAVNVVPYDVDEGGRLGHVDVLFRRSGPDGVITLSGEMRHYLVQADAPLSVIVSEAIERTRIALTDSPARLIGMPSALWR